MKVVYSSDFHVDATDGNRQAVRQIAELMGSAEPDVIIVAGDAGNTLLSLEEALSLFSHLDIPKLFVAGNHDVWIEESSGGRVLDSREKYEKRIPETCRKHGFTDLCQGPVVIESVGFVGSLGWYDYSFADPRLQLSADAYWKGRYEDEIWWDKEMTLWPPSGVGTGMSGERMRDPAVCREMNATLEAHLRDVEDDVEQIVAVVHTLPFLATLPRSEPPYYLDAFTGSELLGRTLASHPKVTHHIGGHKHLSGRWQIGQLWSHRRTLGRVDTDTPVGVYARRAIGKMEI